MTELSNSSSDDSSARPIRRTILLLAVILIVAALRVVSTYHVFSQTYDEAAHIAAGMELLSRGTYLGEPQHPPLARVAAALVPFLAGARPEHLTTLTEQGNEILGDEHYVQMLSLARLGILPFFLMSVIVVWLYARELLSEQSALIAALLYSNLPPVLAHAGLATTDMALTAFLLAAFYALHRWLRQPSVGRAILLGAMTAGALVSKLSSLLFVPICFLVLVVCHFAQHDRPRASLRTRVLGLCLASLAAVLVVWGTYGFSYGRVVSARSNVVDALFERSPLFRALRPAAAHLIVPAPELAFGVAQMVLHNRDGHPSFLLGQHRVGGWWYYFPVAVAVKTPIAFLLLTLLGSVLLLKRATRNREWLAAAPLLASCAIVLSCFPADINIGIRHILPIYPLLAMVVAGSVTFLWTRRSPLARTLALLLCASDLAVSFAAHPDYLPYFNATAGHHPERVLLDSNLDWGQDLLRLSRRCRQLGVPALRLSYFGQADLSRHNLPPLVEVLYDHAGPGHFAVSESNLGSPEYPVTFPWLSEGMPFERIGHSIRLYSFPGRIGDEELLASLDMFLVPAPLGEIPGDGRRRWNARLELTNRGSRAIAIREGLRKVAEAPPHSARIYALPESASPLLIYAARSRSRELEGAVHFLAEGDSRTSVSVPLVPLYRGKSSRVVLDIPPCNQCSRLLSIFDVASPNRKPVSASVSAAGLTRTVALNAVESGGALSWARVDIDVLFPGAGQRHPLEIVVSAAEGENPRLWAFASSTAADGKSSIALPR